jgi:hypothetical protein
MKRPIGVTLLALGAGLLALFEIWRTLVFLGIVNWTFLGKEVSFPTAQWGPAIWAIILAAIWIYVAEGFWNVRAYAWSFGIFISIFTIIFGFFAIIGNGSTTEAESFGWLLAIIIFFYLNYPGVRNVFVEHEMSLLTPEQRAAMQKVAEANAAAAAVMAAPAAAAAPAPAPTQQPPAPPAPPAS